MFRLASLALPKAKVSDDYTGLLNAAAALCSKMRWCTWGQRKRSSYGCSSVEKILHLLLLRAGRVATREIVHGEAGVTGADALSGGLPIAAGIATSSSQPCVTGAEKGGR